MKERKKQRKSKNIEFFIIFKRNKITCSFQGLYSQRENRSKPFCNYNSYRLFLQKQENTKEKEGKKT